MRKISSGFTFFNKRIFPTIWFGFVLASVVVVTFSGALQKNFIFLVVPLFLAGIGFLIMKMVVWDLVDEVFDCGNYLLVKNGGVEDQIYLADIMNVSVSVYVNPPRITLRLRKASKFGTEVTFSPTVPLFRFNPFAKNPVAEDLIVRVDQERLKAAR